MKKGVYWVIILCLFLFPVILSCSKREAGPAGDKAIKVVTTLFPLYDFAKQIGGNLVEVQLLLPPGMEPHSFEPNPGDIRKITDADIFVYTGKFMEPWADDVLRGISNKKLSVVDTSTGIMLDDGSELPEHHHGALRTEGQHKHHQHRHGAKDPHIWLDLSHAQTMVENILNAFVARDPANRQVYIKNAQAYVSQLSSLDKRFRDALSSCRKSVIIHGGHFAFGYLARRYHLTYRSAYRGFSSHAEPAPGDIVELIQILREHRLQYIFFEELVAPNVAETISRETGAKLLMLHGAHNVSKQELDRGVTFISLMERNLENLKIELECP